MLASTAFLAAVDASSLMLAYPHSARTPTIPANKANATVNPVSTMVTSSAYDTFGCSTAAPGRMRNHSHKATGAATQKMISAAALSHVRTFGDGGTEYAS